MKWICWSTRHKWVTLNREPHHDGIIIVSGWELHFAQKKPHTSLVHNVTVWVCFVDLGDIWRCGFHSDLSHRTRYRGTKQTRWGTASHEEWLNSMDVRVLQTATCPQKGGWLRLLWLVIILDYSASTLYRNISLAYINKNYYNNVNSECILCVTLQI